MQMIKKAKIAQKNSSLGWKLPITLETGLRLLKITTNFKKKLYFVLFFFWTVFMTGTKKSKEIKNPFDHQTRRKWHCSHKGPESQTHHGWNQKMKLLTLFLQLIFYKQDASTYQRGCLKKSNAQIGSYFKHIVGPTTKTCVFIKPHNLMVSDGSTETLCVTEQILLKDKVETKRRICNIFNQHLWQEAALNTAFYLVTFLQLVVFKELREASALPLENDWSGKFLTLCLQPCPYSTVKLKQQEPNKPACLLPSCRKSPKRDEPRPFQRVC